MERKKAGVSITRQNMVTDTWLETVIHPNIGKQNSKTETSKISGMHSRNET